MMQQKGCQGIYYPEKNLAGLYQNETSEKLKSWKQ